MKTISITSLILGLSMVLGVLSCRPKANSKDRPTEKDNKVTDSIDYRTFKDDLSFLQAYTPIVELSDRSGKSRIALAPNLQGRVMTSSASGETGMSYGWINRELFESRDTLDHINAFGGEERFWMGPEGGQYSIFFAKGADFNLDNWFTPRLIDLEPFAIKTVSKSKAVFEKAASLTNYSGFQFHLGIEREVALLTDDDIRKELDLDSLEGLSTVAYRTTNTLTNIGKQDWKKETGLLSIWLLGMFNPSPNTTIIIPYNSAGEGPVVNDMYFGKVPEDRLVIKENVVFFKGDGRHRGKIGLSPSRAKNIIGSYDAERGLLTLVKYRQPDHDAEYVNSMWEIQERPYDGDVVNAYNDGAPKPGEKPLGPFYELETSSPALALKAGESGGHTQMTFHVEGDTTVLGPILERILGVGVEEVKGAFE
ncbi:DUF6786 family protein [Pseudozobellia thermophila]|uniref:Lipoprotein n=1 Tax=Pseudozobellia thermophila TaxID=192903 RepID=A0A1M6KSZ1_9FLAO|nr:DUF6786 family protein [Pseudozobellia thermophila]SHJ61994.1 hypothetical protein SAMN04488513_106183 [Pseudozobellia thermophila]